MNYCTKCESFYQKPGTCNCFAGTQPAVITTPQPYDPNSTAQPWPGYTPWVYATVTWGSGTTLYRYVNDGTTTTLYIDGKPQA